MGKIKYIYFDVGGVIIKDFSQTNKWNEMLDDLEVQHAVRSELGNIFKSMEHDICCGKVSVNNFTQRASKKLGISFPGSYSMLDDFVQRFEKNEVMLGLIEELRMRGYKTGLLTNMYPDMLEKIYSRNLFSPNGWDNTIDSSIVRYAKPDIEIYEIAEKKSGYQGAEILFIDNKQENLEIAKNLGWHTLIYNPTNGVGSNQKIMEYLDLK